MQAQMLAGVGAADLALLLRGSEASAGAGAKESSTLNVAEWKNSTKHHDFGPKGEVSA